MLCGTASTRRIGCAAGPAPNDHTLPAHDPLQPIRDRANKVFLNDLSAD